MANFREFHIPANAPTAADFQDVQQSGSADADGNPTTVTVTAEQQASEAAAQREADIAAVHDCVVNGWHRLIDTNVNGVQWLVFTQRQ